MSLQSLENQAAAQLLDYHGKLVAAQGQIITAEATGASWMQRNWRPITMLTFLVLVVCDSFGLLTFRLAEQAWTLLQIGLGGYVVGRSAEKIAPSIVTALYHPTGWPKDMPVIDAIGPEADFDAVTAALSAVGLGSVPAWLRPYPILYNGEKFRADLARVICSAPRRVVIDEFTSVVDRQIAKIGALAFQKAWRRTGGQAVLLSCHYDIVDWVEPDWVFDTATGEYSGRGLWRRPRIEMEIRQTDWRYWPLFEPHHYLKLPHMIAATNYVATVDGELVAHLAVGTRTRTEARACRLVVMPEWQGAGVGLRFLNAVCDRWRRGKNRYGRPFPVLFHTSHPGLCATLRRDGKWCQVSAVLYGASKKRMQESMRRSHARQGKPDGPGSGYGGHFRAVQGFRYMGE